MENKMHFFPYRNRDGKTASEDRIGVTLKHGMNEVTKEQYHWLSVHPHRPISYGLIIRKVGRVGLSHLS